MSGLADRLLAAGAGDVVVDPDVLDAYRSDQAAPGLLTPGSPAVLVRPRSAREVQAAVAVATREHIPVVPRGAGSGLSGGANAVDGCVVLSTERMDRILEVDPGAMLARVEPGALNSALKAAADTEGLFYAPDPASSEFCTVGGNVATNAGGLCCIKYGVTRDVLLGLEVVTAGGRAVRIGRRTRKGVAGYDLVSLFCGSEGTLGLITEVTVRLMPRPARAMTMAASFPELADAGRAVERIVRACTPALLELMDGATIAAVEAMAPMDLDLEAGAMLFARCDSPGSGAREEIAAIERIATEEGASLVVTSDEEAEGRMLLAARRLAYPALERLGTTLLDDVAVPVGRIVALIEAVTEIARRHELVIGTFGHAGDGNLHPTLVYDHRDAEAARRAHAAFREIVESALALEGTVTGEHGVGALKPGLLALELGDAHDLHRSVKRALDPAGIFNPGKGI